MLNIKFNNLTIDEMQQMCANSQNSNQKTQLLKFFAKFQNFSNPIHINLIFKSHPLLILSSPTVSIEQLLLNDSDNFWKKIFFENRIIQQRYVDEFLQQKYPNVFLIEDAIGSQQPLSTHFISKFVLTENISIEVARSLVEHQNLTRDQRNQIRKLHSGFEEQMLKFQNLEDDEIISICYPVFIKEREKFHHLNDVQKHAKFDWLFSTHSLLCRLNKQKISLNVLFHFGAELALFSFFFYHQRYSEEELILIIEFVRGEPIHPYRFYARDVNWDIISERHQLSEDFIFRFRNYVNWNVIAIHQKLSARFIQRFSRHISFKLFFQHNQFITEEIVQKFFKRCFLDSILINMNVDFSIVKRVILDGEIDSLKNFDPDRLNKRATNLKDECKKWLNSQHFWPLDNNEFDSVFDEESLKNDLGFSLNDMLFVDNVIGLCKKLMNFYPANDKEFWLFVWKWCSCSEDFIEFALKTYGDIIVDWETISKYQKLSLSFIMTHRHQINIKSLLVSQSFFPAELDELLKKDLSIFQIMTLKEITKFFKSQQCSQKLLEQFINEMQNQLIYLNIVKTQKLYSQNLINQIIQKYPKLTKKIYRFQQPFSLQEFDFVKTLEFSPNALNIFPQIMANEMINASFIPDKFISEFKILNNIPQTFICNVEFNDDDDDDDNEEKIFHQFLTNEMFETFPSVFFGNGLKPIYWFKNYSIAFIKKWQNVMSHYHLLRYQDLDEELAEFLLINSGHWDAFFLNKNISDELKIKIAIKYNKLLPIKLRRRFD